MGRGAHSSLFVQKKRSVMTEKTFDMKVLRYFDLIRRGKIQGKEEIKVNKGNPITLTKP